MNTNRYEVDNGIARDTATNLMWLRFAHGQLWQQNTAKGIAEEVNWKNAFAVAEDFNKSGGYGWHLDWRLPTIEELKTLIDRDNAKEGNLIHASVFPHNAACFWSSSPFGLASIGYAWVLDFNYGYDYNDTGNSYYAVRLVRGG